MSTWRQRLAPVIEGVIERVGTEDLQALRSELRDAFPYHGRSGWVYRVWLDEINAQLGLGRHARAEPPLRSERRRVDRPVLTMNMNGEERTPVRGQLELF